jgi:hypothetical protein
VSLLAPERRSARLRRVLTGPSGGLPLAGPGAAGVLVLGLLLAAVAAWVSGLLPGLDSPFEERSIDRSPPALLRSLEELREYRAASGHFETIIDLERDTGGLPAFIKGERTLFVAVGSVDAGVDFSRLGPGALDVTNDRRSVTVTLPRARLLEPRVDPARSRVFARERGLVDRVESIFEDQPTSERQLYLLAERKLVAAARDPRSGLVVSAERNTEAMLQRLLGGLGFERVRVGFGSGGSQSRP